MQQTTFDIHRTSFEQSDFIVSDANRLACQIIENYPKTWGVEPYKQALILKGPKSSGKSFLAHNFAVKTSAKFINYKQKISGEDLQSYNNFVIEDINLISDAEILLHNFNILNECHKYLLMTCTDALPNTNLKDLSSRLKSTNSIAINSPDDNLVKILIFKFFSDHFVTIPITVINYLLQYLPRRFDLMNKILAHINNYSLENKQKITIPLIKKIMAEY